jgi:DnaJ-class molecular chaperone
MRYKSHGPNCDCVECRMTGCGAFVRADACIDCDGSGRYPSGLSCKSCIGTGRVHPGDGIPAATLIQ